MGIFRVVIFLLVIGTISVGLSWLLNNDGWIDAEWMGYRLQTSVSFIMIASISVLAAAIFLLNILFKLVTFPTRVIHRRDINNFNKGLTSLTEGFVAIATGDTNSAKYLAKKTKKLLGYQQPLALILEAQAAQIEGDRTLALNSYKALLENPATKVVGLKGLLGEARRSGKTRKILQIAEELHKSKKDREGVEPILLELYKREGRWQDALNLISPSRGKKALMIFSGMDDKLRHEQAILNHMLGELMLGRNKLDLAITHAEKAHKLLPNFLPSTILLTEIAARSDNQQKAVNIIRKTWKTTPHPHLARIFIDIYKTDKGPKQIKIAEKLAALNPEHIESHMLMAHVSMEAGDLERARTNLEQTFKHGETARACSLMARVNELDNPGEPEVAKSWLQRLGNALPDPAWVCSCCLHNDEKWQLICPQCGTIESANWEIFSANNVKIVPAAANKPSKNADLMLLAS